MQQQQQDLLLASFKNKNAHIFVDVYICVCLSSVDKKIMLSDKGRNQHHMMIINLLSLLNLLILI